MKRISYLLFFALCIFSFQVVKAQAPVFDDLVFEEDSTTSAYRPTGKHFIYVKSKKGTGGMPKSSSVDSIKAFPITDIVLVFTETNTGELNTRFDSNRERWENLLSAHPDIFQFNTNYKTICQCNIGGDAETLKKFQGFYIYYEAPPEAKKTEVVKTETPKEVIKETHEPEKETPKKKEESKKEESKPKEEKVTKVEKEEAPKEVKKEEKKEEVAKEEHVEKEEEHVTPKSTPTAGTQKPKFTKPKRAKDPKACRPPFYENGDEDLVNYFVSNISLSKKQKRHGKSLNATVTLMLNFDGTIKKSMVVCADEVFKKQVEGAISAMNPWNPAVKGGLTVKSQIKFILKYEKSMKGMIPTEINITPRPGPKCKIISDSELFD